MSDIGDRIKSERERLGLSQEAFGAIGGVKKLAQLNYEKGKRSPTGEYFECLRQSKDIDVNYIVTGMKTGPEWDDALAHRYVLVNMATAIGINYSDLGRVCDLALLQEKQARLNEEFDPSEVVKMVHDLVNSSAKMAGIDAELLALILEKVEAAVDKFNSKIPAKKKARAVAMFYRTFMSSGKVDQKTIEETIALASS
ncbi:MAG TPA: helix-turn-helix transcriptional regulator [Sulfuriferula sp.]|nr:helix-turn-helix transcriptional regulator [Sulfuriferula sp.]